MKIFKKLWFRIISIIMGLLILLTACFFVYASIYYKADKEAKSALTSTDTVSVEHKDNMWIFSPKEETSEVGYIFYPGGKVEETAYAPLLSGLAKEGITCVLVKVPLRLAVLDVNAGDEARKALPNIKAWYVGGHSLGGAMAATYAGKHADQLAGLILMGAYPTSDLTDTNLRMLSFYGSEDGVLNRTNLEKNKKNQPLDTTYFEIQGGNHAYYGNYGEQKGDNQATITPEEQQQQVIENIMQWLQK